ncbi:MAG: ribosome silencing factor, partial [Devosia sp.]
VTTGRSNRHVGAVADQLIKALREAGFGKPRVEGLPHCDWVLVAGGDVIVHIFRPYVRVLYNIEKLWQAEFAG